MIHQYEHKDQLNVTMQLPTRDNKKRNIQFIAGELCVDDTDDSMIATDIEATRSFKMGEIRKVVGEIKRAARKYAIVSGARGTDTNNQKKEL